MSQDYFANAVYGVEVDDDDAQRLDEKYREAYGLAQDEDLEGWFDDTAENAVREAYGEELRLKYGAPPGVALHLTGDEDERPGRCDTEAGIWLLGFGLLNFPLPRERGDPFDPKDPHRKFWNSAGWHTWVEAG